MDRLEVLNKLPTKYDFGDGNLTLFDATTGRELSNLDNVHLDSCEVEKGTQFGNWMRQKRINNNGVFHRRNSRHK